MNAGKFVKKLRIESNSVVLIKRDSTFAKIIYLEQLSDAIKKAGLINVIFIIADDFDDLDIIDEARMNELGWERMDSKNTRYPVIIRETTEISSEISQQ